MQTIPPIDDHDESGNLQTHAFTDNSPSPLQLKLVSKKIPIKYCEFKISNAPNKMLTGETVALSALGIMYNSSVAFLPGSLMRVWIEMPDYWARKSRLVGYRHTEAPSYFQMLARCLTCEESGKRNTKFQLMCQTVNLDPIDELVLSDYLGCEVGNS